MTAPPPPPPPTLTVFSLHCNMNILSWCALMHGWAGAPAHSHMIYKKYQHQSH